MIKKLPIIDWEPACIRVKLDIFSNQKARHLSRAIRNWLDGDRSRFGCGCRLGSYDSDTDPATRSLLVKAEWVCEKCLVGLEATLKEQIGGIASIELGLKPPKQLSTRAPFIHVPSKMVEFEDGRTQAVDSFMIGKNPVAVREFEQFAQAAGYIATAEELGKRQTFRNHGGLGGIAEELRGGAQVAYVTHDDALAYCSYHGVRLPSEAEWLAAAVNEPRELDLSPNEELTMRLAPLAKNKLMCMAWDITSTQTPDGLVVARQGPQHFKKRNWREPRELNFHRRLLRRDEFDPLVTFRVVRARKQMTVAS